MTTTAASRPHPGMTTAVSAARTPAATCLVCGEARVERFLDLGRTALANRFLTAEELDRPEPRYPLRVGFCHGCSHVQLLDRVPPEAMFTDYLYISSASETLKAHLWSLSDAVVQRYGLRPTDLVMDIGCNDGTLLRGFARHGVRTLGVDPAENLAALAAQSGLERLERYVGFFNARTAEEILARWGHASVITATNTFPHIPEPADFLQGIKTMLSPEGVFVIEAHYLLDLLEQLAFDTVYHEHVSYWALEPMLRLFRRAGLEVVRAERLPIHHGQLRVFVQHAGASPVQASVGEQLALEERNGLRRFDTYERFAGRVLRLRDEIRRRLQELRAQGKRVAAYGAPAKGNTLLAFIGLGPEEIAYVVDKSPLKQGRYTPGTHIPVVPPERLLEDQPDYVLLLAWNFADEIMAQQAAYRQQGGTFVLPVPRVQILSEPMGAAA